MSIPRPSWLSVGPVACPGWGRAAGRQHVGVRMPPHVVQRRVAQYVGGLGRVVHGVAPARPRGAQAASAAPCQRCMLMLQQVLHTMPSRCRHGGALQAGPAGRLQGRRAFRRASAQARWRRRPAWKAGRQQAEAGAHHSWYSTVVRGRLGSDMSLNTSTKGTSRIAACAAQSALARGLPCADAHMLLACPQSYCSHASRSKA